MAGRNMRFEYDVGEVVLCFEPDSTKARVLYDAKVVEQRSTKDAAGKKKPSYLVHFQGWNSSWDREVGEHYLLRNTDENRELKKKLADTAKKFCRKNNQRRRKINAILHETFGGSPPELDDISDSDESDEESDPGKKTVRSKAGPERKRQKTSVVEFEIPDNLKVHLEEDYFLINKRNKLTQVPAKPCIIDILESFMKTFCVNYLCDPSGGREKTRNSSSKHTLKCPPDKCVSLCKEFVDSLRIIFDFTLPIILLYAAEQQQYETALKDIKPADLTTHDREGQLNDTFPKTAKASSSNSKIKPERATRLHPQQQQQQTSQQLHCSSSPAPSPPSSVSEETSPVTPPRRITRRAAHEIPKSDPPTTKVRTSASSHNQHKSPKQSENTSPKALRRSVNEREPIIPIASRTRRRSQLEVVEVSSGIIVKQEPSSDSEVDHSHADLSGPSQLEQPQVNGQEAACSAAGTESMTMGSSRGREDAMDRILSWQLLPMDVRANGPITPSQIYGTVHLLRMFVKLPDLLKKMHMKDVQLQIIIKFIHHCLQYLVDHQSDLFHENYYIKA